MIRIVTAAQSGAIDDAVIASGTPSFDLMRAAGERAAAVITTRFAAHLANPVIFAGPGNNGGDGWVVAAALAVAGHPVRVVAVGEPRTADATRAKALYERAAPSASAGQGPPATLVVDALLGTGARGAPRGDVAAAIAAMARAGVAGAPVVALDVPSGLDATTGADVGAVTADLTITFGTIKRGLLIARGRSGSIVVVDIGLGAQVEQAHGTLGLADANWVRSVVPPIPAESHKGIRRRVCVVGGDVGMAGATVLASRGATRSGVGMVRLLVHDRSLTAVQVGAPEATAAPWPTDDATIRELINGYAHAVLIGPGLGRGATSQALLERVLDVWRGPVVLDADALSLFTGRLDVLRAALAGRRAVLTPHASEGARLMGVSTDDVLRDRFTIPFELAMRTGAVVLLKGVPTVVAAPDGQGMVSASGTPALAAAGSGDVLGGIAVTLLAQSEDALAAAASAAWVHGRAAELANAGRPIRGVTLDDVCTRLADVWRFDVTPGDPAILGELPSVGDRLAGATSGAAVA